MNTDGSFQSDGGSFRVDTGDRGDGAGDDLGDGAGTGDAVGAGDAVDGTGEDPEESLGELPLVEIRRRQREVIAQLRDAEHWRRLVAARLDLAIAAVTDIDDLPEVRVSPRDASPRVRPPRDGSPRDGSPHGGSPHGGSPHGGSPRVRPPRDGSARDGSPAQRERRSRPLPSRVAGAGDPHDANDSRPRYVTLPDTAQDDALSAAVPLRDLLGIPRSEGRLPESALLLQLRDALRDLDSYAGSLRSDVEATARALAAKLDGQSPDTDRG